MMGSDKEAGLTSPLDIYWNYCPGPLFLLSFHERVALILLVWQPDHTKKSAEVINPVSVRTSNFFLTKLVEIHLLSTIRWSPSLWTCSCSMEKKIFCGFIWRKVFPSQQRTVFFRWNHGENAEPRSMGRHWNNHQWQRIRLVFAPNMIFYLNFRSLC